MTFLVHLEVQKMTVTVFTAEEFAMDEDNQKGHDDDEIAKVEDKSDHSEEMSDGGNEFSKLEPALTNSTVNIDMNASINSSTPM